MSPESFLSLKDILLVPPLPALVGIVLALGLIGLGRRLMQVLLPDSDRVERLAGPIVAATLLGITVEVLALAGLAQLEVVRVLAVFLGLAGLFEIARMFKHRDALQTAIADVIDTAGAFPGSRWLAFLGALIFALLVLMSIGPATNADSLSYHLSVALLTLATGGIGMRPEWFSSHLAGLGELVNAVGLSAGSDIFSSVLQIIGLSIVLLTISAIATTRVHKLLALLVILAVPIWLFLVPSAKPMLLPSAGLTVVLTILSREHNALGVRRIFLVSLLAAFALANKFSYAFPVAVLGSWFLWRSWRAKELDRALAVSLVTFLVVAAPLLIFRWLAFGDPLSPMLTDPLHVATPGASEFAAFLRNYSDNPMPIVLNLFVPRGIGLITSVFLYAPLVAIVFLAVSRSWTSVTAATLGVSILDLTFGQQGTRFFIDPLFWLSVAVAQTKSGKRHAGWTLSLIPQLLAMFALAVFGAATLLPGALTPHLYEHVMENAGYEYSSMVWLDRNLPKNAVLLSFGNPSQVRRPMMASDGVTYAAESPHKAQARSYFKKIAIERGVTLVATFAGSSQATMDAKAGILAPCLVKRILGPKTFTMGTRNPFNRVPYVVEVWRPDFTKC